MLIDIAHLIDSKSVEEIPEPLQHGRQATEELRIGHQRTVASYHFPARRSCGQWLEQLSLSFQSEPRHFGGVFSFGEIYSSVLQ